MELVVLTIAVLFIAGAVGWHAVDVFAAKRLATRQRVLVVLSSGRAVTGVLWARKGRCLVLKSAEMHEPGQEAISMDGDVVLDRDQVEYVQVAG